MSDTAVQIEHLTHAYGERLALDDLSLSVPAGAIFGFLGPNGSGKTTLFRILSTLIAARPGTVSVLGLDLATQRQAVREQIGVVFQAPSLDKQLTARENLKHQGHLYGLGGDTLRARIDELLTRFNLADRREYVGSFSGGMRRRVEIAKGLLHRPRLLLLDEPSTGLDPGARIDLWQQLHAIRDDGNVTILLTTHLMEEADQCDRLAVLDRGRLLACDTPANLKATIGGDVLTLTTAHPQQAADAIRSQLGLEAQLVDGALRLEAPSAHTLIPRLVEALPGLVDSVSMGRPTLQDVFVKLTGHGLEHEPAAGGVAVKARSASH